MGWKDAPKVGGYQSAPTIEEFEKRSVLNPVGEAIATLGTGAVAAPMSGLIGTAGALLPGPQGQGADWARQIQGLAYQPKTQQGKDAVAAISYIPEKFAQGATWLGEQVTDLTGSPEHGVAATLAPHAVALALGGRGMLKKPSVAPATKTPVSEAFEAGYRLTPTQAERGIVPRAIEGLVGSAKMEKLTSIHAAKNTARLIKEEFGIPEKQNITVEALENIRSREGQAYEAVKSSVKIIKPDKKFMEDAQKLRGDFTNAAKEYPDLIKNDAVETLIDSITVPASPRAMVELTKKLRKDATSNLKSFDDPAKRELGFAQRNAATAIENMIDRALTSVGKKDMVRDWRSARRKIAQTHDIEAALNEVTGEVSNVVLGKMHERGTPFTGAMEKAARFSRAFKGSSREVGKMLDTTQFGYGDLLAGMLSSGVGGSMFGPFGAVAGTAVTASRPLLRQLLIQRNKPAPLLPPTGATGLLPLLGNQNDERYRK
jgi:hypothetical protein